MISNATSYMNIYDMTNTEAIANSIVKSAFNLKCPVIICETDLGRLPRYISKYRPYSQLIVVAD